MMIPFLHGQTVCNLTNNFQSDSKSQYSMKKMIVNPNKFEATLLYEKLLDHANPKFLLYIQAIKWVSSSEVIGIYIDDKLKQIWNFTFKDI